MSDKTARLTTTSKGVLHLAAAGYEPDKYEMPRRGDWDAGRPADSVMLSGCYASELYTKIKESGEPFVVVDEGIDGGGYVWVRDARGVEYQTNACEGEVCVLVRSLDLPEEIAHAKATAAAWNEVLAACLAEAKAWDAKVKAVAP